MRPISMAITIALLTTLSVPAVPAFADIDNGDTVCTDIKFAKRSLNNLIFSRVKPIQKGDILFFLRALDRKINVFIYYADQQAPEETAAVKRQYRDLEATIQTLPDRVNLDARQSTSMIYDANALLYEFEDLYRAMGCGILT